MLLLGCPWGQCPIKKQILSMSKETNINGGWNSQKALHVPFPPLMKPIFVGRRRVIPSHVANKFGSWFGTNEKLLRGVNGPISTTNDYLNTAYNDVVCLCGSCRNNALSRTHRKRFDLLQFSPNMWRVFPLFIDFPSNTNIFTWIVRRALNAISDRNKIAFWFSRNRNSVSFKIPTLTLSQHYW